MPFVDKAHRDHPDENIAGDRCYLHYKYMMEEWTKEPRWTTADRLYGWVVDLNQPSLDWQRAKELAWQVFFQKVVMKYENQKEKENGSIS